MNTSEKKVEGRKSHLKKLSKYYKQEEWNSCVIKSGNNSTAKSKINKEKKVQLLIETKVLTAIFQQNREKQKKNFCPW